MPQLQKPRKVKRATMLIKRSQCLKSFPKYKSYKPLCEKLKHNNNTLAKALSKEKQESQLLFSQNVALIAEVQDLNLACSKRDVVISNVLENAKEILKMLVTMTGYVTNTISTCQEFEASSGANIQKSCSSTGRRESSRRLSTKSPARGVVKPMVSGHTITKPTINLSRVNMQRLNNSSSLSVIEEVTTPPRNQEINNSRSPVAIPIGQRRCESGRTCRMPERLTVTSPRNSEENERRLSKRTNRHSGRLSGKRTRPKSARLSGSHSTRRSAEHVEHMGSPRVKLNDVSRLLQNSQSINIRMLDETQSNRVDETVRNNNDANHKHDRSSVTIPETPPTDTSNSAIDPNNPISKDTDEETENESCNENCNTTDGSNKSASNTNNTANWDDPLEGPSWLYDNSPAVPPSKRKDVKTDRGNGFRNANASAIASEAVESDDGEEEAEVVGERSQNYSTEEEAPNENEGHASLQDDGEDDTLCKTREIFSRANSNENARDDKSNRTVKFENFVTHRRRYCAEEQEMEDDMDDFTLIYTQHPRNMHFDINDLRLPVLDESAIKRPTVTEPEPEITATIQKITQTYQIPTLSNNSMNESVFNQSTVKLPLLTNHDYDKGTPLKDKQFETVHQKKKSKRATLADNNEYVECTPMLEKSNAKQKKRSTINKDPSAVKVVLQKLNESDVKPRTPSPDEMDSRDTKYSKSPVSSRLDNSSDSESNNSTNGIYAVNRLRRKRAPVNFQEPSLRVKLRRNH